MFEKNPWPNVEIVEAAPEDWAWRNRLIYLFDRIGDTVIGSLWTQLAKEPQAEPVREPAALEPALDHQTN